LKDEQFPRAVAFSLRELGAALAMLPRNGEPLSKLGDLRRLLARPKVLELDLAGLHQWIDDAQLALGELHGLIQATWFRPSTSTTVEPPAGRLTKTAPGSQTQTQALPPA
jgi:uncharacterized alpha-E superfamily protein